MLHRLNQLLISQKGHNRVKPEIIKKFSELRKLTEFLGDSVQPRKVIVTSKILSPDVVSWVNNALQYVCGRGYTLDSGWGA